MRQFRADKESIRMNDHENAPLMDHTVDGISELDNRLPRWWVWLFYISVGFSIVYLA